MGHFRRRYVRSGQQSQGFGDVASGEGEAVSSGDQASVRSVRPALRETAERPQCEEGPKQDGTGAASALRYLRVQEIIRCRPDRDDLVRVDRNISEAVGGS